MFLPVLFSGVKLRFICQQVINKAISLRKVLRIQLCLQNQSYQQYWHRQY